MSIISELKPDVKNTVKWVAVGLISIALGFAFYKFFSVIEKNAEYAAKHESEKNARELAELNRDNLQKEIEANNAKLAEIEAQNSQLKEKVESSRKVISSLAAQRDEALKLLDEEVLPDSCEEKFRWMQKQADSLKERHE